MWHVSNKSGKLGFIPFFATASKKPNERESYLTGCDQRKVCEFQQNETTNINLKSLKVSSLMNVVLRNLEFWKLFCAFSELIRWSSSNWEENRTILVLKRYKPFYCFTGRLALWEKVSQSFYSATFHVHLNWYEICIGKMMKTSLPTLKGVICSVEFLHALDEGFATIIPLLTDFFETLAMF